METGIINSDTLEKMKEQGLKLWVKKVLNLYYMLKN
jgi:hypothetical protein